MSIITKDTLYPADSLRSPVPFVAEPYWLLHHEILLEWTSEPVGARVEYIRTGKPKNEIPVRLQALRKVKNVNRIPETFLKAYAYAYAYGLKFSQSNKDALIALHKEECPDVNFDYEKRTLIFPK